MISHHEGFVLLYNYGISKDFLINLQSRKKTEKIMEKLIKLFYFGLKLMHNEFIQNLLLFISINIWSYLEFG